MLPCSSALWSSCSAASALGRPKFSVALAHGNSLAIDHCGACLLRALPLHRLAALALGHFGAWFAQRSAAQVLGNHATTLARGFSSYRLLQRFEPLANSIRNSVSSPFSFERRNSAETVSDELHETSRAIQSSRLVPVPFHTMSTCYLTSGSTATRAHASCVGERVTQSPLKSPFFTHK